MVYCFYVLRLSSPLRRRQPLRRDHHGPGPPLPGTPGRRGPRREVHQGTPAPGLRRGLDRPGPCASASRLEAKLKKLGHREKEALLGRDLPGYPAVEEGALREAEA